MSDPTKGGWCPADWLDETVPGLHADPDLSISIGADGCWHVRPHDDPDADEYDRIVVEGEIVNWCRMDDFGSIRMSVLEDGSTNRMDAIPQGADLFCVSGLPESVSDTPEEALGEDPDPGIHDVHAYRWSEPIPHRMRLIDGSPAFVRVGSPRDVGSA